MTVAIALSMVAVLPSAAAERLPDQPAVSTFAGSGALGFADGPGASASFTAPIGLRFGPDGNLYVADRGAERIREISPAGVVTTIAGSGDLDPLGVGVPGGFADGPAAMAKFNDPEDVAVLPNGDVLVTDTANHCIREVARGVVSTYAGFCGEPGNNNGQLLQSRFERPRSIAVTSKGDVYVVDPPNGIRKLSAGTVSSVQFSHSQDAVAVATTATPSDTLLVSSINQIDTVDLKDDRVIAELPLDTSYIAGAQRISVMPAGPPTGLAGFSADDILYADPYDDELMLLQIGYRIHQSYLRVLGAVPPITQPTLNTPFRDGAAGTATFNEPVSVAIAPDGRIAVADLANRRIRMVSAFDHETYVTRLDTNTEVPDAPNSKVFRIAIVGSSYVGSLQGHDDSIAGEVEQMLATNRAAGTKPVEVYTMMRAGAANADLLSYIDTTFSDGGFDAVVFDLADRSQFPFLGQRLGDPPDPLYPTDWPKIIRERLVTVSKHLAANGSKLYVLLHPGTGAFQDETAYLRIEKGSPPDIRQLSATLKDPAAIDQYRADALSAVADTGIPVIDCWPALLADHARATRETLYMNWDHHFSPHGRMVLARAIADYFQSVVGKR